MTDALKRLRPVFGPDWPVFLGQFRADLRAQRAVLARPGAAAARQSAHVVAALAGTAGDEALAALARRCLAGDAAAADLVPGIDRLLARLDGLAAGADA